MIRTVLRNSSFRFTIFTVLAMLLQSGASAQPPPGHPMMGGMPKIVTVELTEASAKNSIDAYLELREKYGDKLPPANEAEALAQGTQAMADVNAVVTEKGFKDVQAWQAAITSVAVASGFAEKGNADDMDEKMAELEANPHIPDAYKQQMLATMKSIRPSKNNLKVVEELKADPAYGKKIAELSK